MGQDAVPRALMESDIGKLLEVLRSRDVRHVIQHVAAQDKQGAGLEEDLDDFQIRHVRESGQPEVKSGFLEVG